MSHGRNDAGSTNNKDRSFLKNVISASFGGVFGAFAAYPFEGLKKSVQAGLITSNVTPQKGRYHLADQPKLENFKNALSLFMNPKELYRGTGAFATSLVPTTIIQMSAKQYFDQQALSDNTRFATDLLSASSGSIASTAAEKMILTQRLYKIGPSAAFSHIIAKQGFFGLWNGISAIATREMIFGTCMLRYSGLAYDRYGFLGTLGLGFTGAALSHAPDCVATRLQLMSLKTPQGKNADIAYSPPKIREAVKSIYKEQGAKGFTKGLFWRFCLFTTAMTVIPAASKFIARKLDDTQAPKQSHQ